MNASLNICQERYDAQLPPEISETDAEQEWLEQSVERLVCGMDIKWEAPLRPDGGIRRPDHNASNEPGGCAGNQIPLQGIHA